MLPDGSIRVEHLWKRFRADRARLLLRDELQQLRRRVKRRGGRQFRWVLRDLTLSVQPGEAVGLVGINGSGKSTLLKILTGVMYPYAGRLDVRGRVGALIEVRAGIHPDLTGRENVYLYGSLLGLPRREVMRRFDEIVDFAELSNAIDRQVKFYSTGMQMRLGFGVAAFLEPDLLLVDEVLAVGDSAFQQKCLDRMRVVIEQGTTLILVSHDLAAVEASCSRGVWLQDGVIVADGDVRTTLQSYRASIEEQVEHGEVGSQYVRLRKVEVAAEGGGLPLTGGPVELRLVFDSDYCGPAVVHLGVSEGTPAPVFCVRHELDLPSGESSARCVIENLPLPAGRFALYAGIDDDFSHALMNWQPAGQFDVSGPVLEPPPRAVMRAAPIHVEQRWDDPR